MDNVTSAFNMAASTTNTIATTAATAATTISSINDSFLDANASDNMNGTWPGGYSGQPGVVIQILARFYLIARPTIVILGIISNTLSFCIFVSKTLRRTSCSIYLAARSVSDTGLLLSIFFSWLGDAMAVPVVNTVVVCQLFVFSGYVFGFLSVWLVVFITLENYIRICHPFSVSRFCTPQKARQVLFGLVLVCLAIYQFPLWMTHVADHGGSQMCLNKPEFMHIFQALVYADMIITLALPSIVIIFFMIAITVSLVTSLKRQSRLKGNKPPAAALNNHSLTQDANGRPSPGGATSTSRGAGGNGGQANGTQRSTKKKPPGKKSSSPQAKVTKLLFAVSCTFLVLSLPSHIVRLRMTMLQLMEQPSLTPSLDEKLSVVFLILYYMSFAVNLVVYLSFGESFRNVFIETYVTCIVGKGAGRRRRSEISHTSYTVVRPEAPETLEKKEEETSLIN